LDHLFFDLDGTLTDSRKGITRCIQHAMTSLGRAVPVEGDLLHCIGPPLVRIFSHLLDTDNVLVIEQAIAAYRVRYESIGIFEATLWPGIEPALRRLSSGSTTLHLVTSKPTVYARRILDAFDVGCFFKGVYGPELTSRGYDKMSLIRGALTDIGCAPERAVMIGDRAEDAIGARNNGVRSIAVTWGYGGPVELNEAAPDYVVRSVDDLIARLEMLA